MADVTTLDEIYWPLMHLPPETVEVIENSRFCIVCGATWPLNRHHIVFRSAGELYEDGKKVPKPCITLCGSGNASGCHGLAHSRMLHFRNNGGMLECLMTPEPTRYHVALDMPGWRVPPGLAGSPAWVRHGM
jgi:hypothetical protein